MDTHAAAPSEKQEFKNTTQGVVGAVRIDRKGDEIGVPVQPGESVFLSQEEQIATANAPRSKADNPFLPQPFKIVDELTAEVVEEGVRPSLELVGEARDLARPIGGAVGSYAPGEHTGTPVG